MTGTDDDAGERSPHREQFFEITSDPDLTTDEKIARILALTCDRLGVENAHLVEIDEDRGRHEVVAAGGSDVVTEGMVSDLARTYCRRTIRDGGLLSVEHAAEEGWADDPAYEEHGLECYVGVRIDVDGDLYGTVCFVDRDPVEGFGESEHLFVDMVAIWLGNALENQERERRLEELHRSTRNLFNCQDVESVCRRAVHTGASLLDLPCVSVWVHRQTPDGPVLEPVAQTDDATELIDETPTFEPGNSLAWQAFASGETLAVDDLRERADVYNPETPLRSEIIVPLGEYGVLAAGSTSQAAFSAFDRRAMQVLAANARTALRQVEREDDLVSTTTKLTALVEELPAGVIVFDGSRRVEYANHTAKSIFGIDENVSVVGQSVAETVRSVVDRLADVVDPEGAAEQAQRVLDEGETRTRETIQLDTGATVEWSYRPIDLHTGERAHLALFYDVTDRRRRIQMVEVLNRVLRHNLRNDGNVVLGHGIELADSTAGAQQAAAEAIVATTEELIALSQKARRIQALIEDTDPATTLDLADVARTAVGWARENFDEPPIRLSAPDAARARANERTVVAVRELLDNAVSHADPSEITVSVDANDGDTVALTVTDDGVGIPDEERRILERGEETPLEHGSGLGLWLVNWIATSVGGTVAVETSPGGGTAVTLDVPRSDRFT